MTDLMPVEEIGHYMELGRKALDALPPTQLGVAHHLHGLGVKAECGNSERCAIAEYLNESAPLPDAHTWYVSSDDFGVTITDKKYIETSYGRRNGTTAFLCTAYDQAGLLPGHIENFVLGFDNHEYPYLEKEDS